MKWSVVLFLVFSFTICFAENSSVDSLESMLPEHEGKEKLSLYFKILNELWETSSGKSIQYGQEAIDLAKLLEDSKAEQKAMVYIANAYEMRSDFPAALDFYLRCIALAEPAGNNNLLSLCYNNAGIINKKMKNYETAIEFYQKSLALKKMLCDTFRLATSYNNIGTLYRKLKQYNVAVMYFDSALNMVNLTNENPNKRLTALNADILTNLGNIYNNDLHDEDIDLLSYFNKALELRVKSNDKYNEAITLLSIGDYYVKNKQYEQPERFFDDAEKIAEALNNQDLMSQVYSSKFNFFYATKQYKQAADALRNHTNLKDTIYSKDREKIILELQTKYETEKKEKENLTLKKDNEIKALLLSRKSSLIFSMAAGILISISLLVTIYLLYRKRNIAYKNLVAKNLELAQCDRKILGSGNFIPDNIKEKHEASPDTNPELHKELEIIEKLNLYLSEEKPYLYSNITIEDIASQIGTNRTYLSKAINHVFNKSYNTLINEFRVRAARQLMTDSKYDHISLEGIGQMVGYNSRNVFTSNFKKVTGLTPSYFRESIST